MDLSALLTRDAFLKLQCTHCKNYLSHFPIYIMADKQNICGRCPPQDGKCVQNEVYEALAQFVPFPCRYKQMGCQENLTPADIPTHEKQCDFRVIRCPTKYFTLCDWEGDKSACVHHCQVEHCDIMLKNGEFQLDLSQSYQSERLLEYNSVIYLVSQKFYSINKLLELWICSQECETDIEEISYEVKFCTDNRILTVKCYTTQFGREKITEIFLDSLMDRDNVCSTVQVKINLGNVAPKEETVSDQPLVNEELLAKLSCLTCKEYALPPIYQSETAHVSSNIIRCSNCEISSFSPTKGVRRHISVSTNGKIISPGVLNVSTNREIHNETLDEIANSQNYPCIYSKSGCTFISKPPQMKTHQMFCPFGTHNCPVSEFTNCLWFGLGINIASHIRETHGNMIIEGPVPESIISKSNSEPQLFGCKSTKSTINKCYITQFANCFFRVNFAEIGENYHWTVGEIGSSESGFMFELEIVDNNGKRGSLITKQPCTPLKKKDELFASSECYFNRGQIQKFVSNDSLTFKIQVYK